MKKFFFSNENLIAFALALIPAIAIWIVKPEQPIPMYILVIIGCFTIVLIWLCIKLCYDKKELISSLDNEHETLTSYGNLEIIECTQGKCVCKTNPYLRHGTVVSFYRNIGKSEDCIGYGVIETISNNNFVQIIPQTQNDEFNKPDELYAYIEIHSNEIKVIPTLTVDTFQKIIKEISANGGM